VVVNVAVVVAVAGVITLGHGHGHDDDQDHVHDHHSSLRLGARLDHGKACSSGAALAFAALVAGLRSQGTSGYGGWLLRV
jgi:hypothetical protein